MHWVRCGLQFDNTGLYPILSLNSILGKNPGFAFGGDIKYIFTEIIELQLPGYGLPRALLQEFLY
jgi:hypothetical protein